MAQVFPFGEGGLERSASPDKLDQYIRISSPRAWMALLATALLIVAACAFCMVATVPRTESVELSVVDGVATADAGDVPDGTYRAEVEVGEQRLVDMLFGW